MSVRIFFALLLCGLATCQTPEKDPLASSDLAEVRALMAAGKNNTAWRTLQGLEKEEFDRFAQAEYSQLAGDLAYENGDFDLAISNYENFLLAGATAQDSLQAASRLFEMGCAYMDGEARILGVFSNSHRGVVTLQNLAAWAPDSPYAPECLARVAGAAFESNRFSDADADYKTLLRFYPDSEWADLARFRIGLCGLEMVKGPWSDPKLVAQAKNQLEAYLAQAPSGLHREEAVEAVSHLEELAARHEVLVGDYYLSIGNIRGARLHFQEAAGRLGTSAAETANLRLADLPSDPEPPDPEIQP